MSLAERIRSENPHLGVMTMDVDELERYEGELGSHAVESVFSTMRVLGMRVSLRTLLRTTLEACFKMAKQLRNEVEREGRKFDDALGGRMDNATAVEVPGDVFVLGRRVSSGAIWSFQQDARKGARGGGGSSGRTRKKPVKRGFHTGYVGQEG